MRKAKIKVNILPNLYLNEDGTFAKEAAVKSFKLDSVNSNTERLEQAQNIEGKNDDWVNMALNEQNIYDHILISFNFQNIPKILAMVLSNEQTYYESKKSEIHAHMQNSAMNESEKILYNQWINVFKIKIKEKYGHIYDDSEIQSLAQKNAQYLLSVFIPTQMIYSTSLRQINNLASEMLDYIEEADWYNTFERELAYSMKDFIYELERLNVIDKSLMKNENKQKLSLFGKNLDKKEDYFGDVYSTSYTGSFAQLEEALKHGSISYQMETLDDQKFFIPPIIAHCSWLVDEWLSDMKKAKQLGLCPQGELVKIRERGKYDDFIFKCQENLSSNTQLEMMLQTKETLMAYKNALDEFYNPLADNIKNYFNEAMCRFSYFNCLSDVNFKNGKSLTRKI